MISPAEEGKVYLGDGVYACPYRGGGFIITTENGVDVTNEIVLDWETFANLTFWIKERFKR